MATSSFRIGVLSAAIIAPTAMIEPAAESPDVVVQAIAARSRAAHRDHRKAIQISHVGEDCASLIERNDLAECLKELMAESGSNLGRTWADRAHKSEILRPHPQSQWHEAGVDQTVATKLAILSLCTCFTRLSFRPSRIAERANSIAGAFTRTYQLHPVVRVLRDQKQSIISGTDAIATMRAIDAIYACTGR